MLIKSFSAYSIQELECGMMPNVIGTLPLVDHWAMSVQ